MSGFLANSSAAEARRLPRFIYLIPDAKMDAVNNRVPPRSPNNGPATFHSNGQVSRGGDPRRFPPTLSGRPVAAKDPTAFATVDPPMPARRAPTGGSMELYRHGGEDRVRRV